MISQPYIAGNGWLLARDFFLPFGVIDPGWAAQGDPTPLDGNGNPVPTFRLPYTGGRPPTGLKVMYVAADANGNPVTGDAPMRITLMEIVRPDRPKHHPYKVPAAWYAPVAGLIQLNIELAQVTPLLAPLPHPEAEYVIQVNSASPVPGANYGALWVAPMT